MMQNENLENDENVLEKYGRDVVELARQGKIDPGFRQKVDSF